LFAKDFTAVFPKDTRTVSVTGKICSQSCSHCGKKYLHNMENLEDTIRKGRRAYTSALISGGMNNKNYVPIDKCIGELKVMKSWGWKLNLHTGLINPEAADKIKPFADKISFDLVLDDNTIKAVYNIDKKGSDFLLAFDYLSASASVTPHLTIGLLGGEIKGEYEVINALAERNIKELVFIVFKPTSGTDFEHKNPPSLEAAGKLISYARNKLPGVNFTLGCMRPKGKYNLELEKLCLKYDFNKMVLPSKETLSFVNEAGFNIVEKRECCIL